MSWSGKSLNVDLKNIKENPDGSIPFDAVSSDSTSGVESVEAKADEVIYFNLQSMKILNPENGIFIRKTGNRTEKVIL